jgi:5-methylcytosine-specific restriction endonuclease McrA
VTSVMQVLEQSVVVFSQNYLPLCRVNIKRAIVLLVTEKAEALDFATESFWQVHSPSLVLDVPLHLTLTNVDSRILRILKFRRHFSLTAVHVCLRRTLPRHIRLKIASSERMWKVPPVNRREVLRRDHHSCQYCGNNKHLTLDHVIPRSRDGKHTWDNVVTACSRCNSKKSDRTLQEAGMHLRTKPKAPVHPTIAFAEQFWMQANLE